jgi:hypothetical protein
MRAGTFTEDRDVVRITAESRDVVPDPAQRHHQIAQKQIALARDIPRRQRRQIKTTQRAEPIVDRYIHTAAASQARTVVNRRGRAAQDVAAAVHEDHDG